MPWDMNLMKSSMPWDMNPDENLPGLGYEPE